MLGSKRSRLIFPVTLIVGILVIWFVLVGKPAPDARPLQAAPVPAVAVQLTPEETVRLSVQSQGVVSAHRRIEVVAEVNGRVKAMGGNFETGVTFDKDELLLAIDDTDYVAAVSQAKASVADAERALAVERGSARQAKREWRDLNSSEANSLFLREPQIASASAALDAAQAALSKAENDLARTLVSLPFEGRVLRKEVDLGEYVLTGSTIAEVFALDSAEIRLPLSTEQFYKLGAAVGAPVTVWSGASDADFEWSGVIDRVEADVDPASRLHHVIAKLENPFVRDPANNRPPLALGQYVEAQIGTLDEYQAYEIPRDALRAPQSIWVLDPENRLLTADVEILERNSRVALVKLTESSEALLRERLESRFDDGLRVVTSNLSLAFSGMLVEVNATN